VSHDLTLPEREDARAIWLFTADLDKTAFAEFTKVCCPDQGARPGIPAWYREPQRQEGIRDDAGQSAQERRVTRDVTIQTPEHGGQDRPDSDLSDQHHQHVVLASGTKNATSIGLTGGLWRLVFR